MLSGAGDKREDRMRDSFLVAEYDACRNEVILDKELSRRWVSTRVQRQAAPSGVVKEPLREGIIVPGYVRTSRVGRDSQIAVFLCGSGQKVTGGDPCW
jgi:hypothetical protein